MKLRLFAPLLLMLSACSGLNTPAPTATLLPSPRLEDIQTALAGTLTALPSRTGQPSPSAIVEATATPSLPTPIPPSEAPAAPSATLTSPTESAVPIEPGPPPEAILILEPGVTSRVTSPVHVTGMADPTFEQTLVVQVLDQDGTPLSQTPTTIGADAGQRGPFEVDVSFVVAADQPGRVVVYADSPRDGRILHLASVEVTLLAGGTAAIVPGQDHAEQIVISEPRGGAAVSGGVVHVAGMAAPTFENDLAIEVQDEQGNIVGTGPTTINAPNFDQSGPYATDITYSVSSEQPGRIVVYDTSARDGGLLHLNSVEITLAP